MSKDKKQETSQEKLQGLRIPASMVAVEPERRQELVNTPERGRINTNTQACPELQSTGKEVGTRKLSRPKRSHETLSP